MAKVKIQGNASGTGILTVTAPNTSTDRTITLPDEDVTLGAATPSIDDNGNATAITIDSDENVLIGKTSLDNSTVGIRMDATGSASFCADGNRPLVLNRTTSNGDVALFLKDNTTVGSIGAVGTEMYIGSPSGSGGFVRFQSLGLLPATSAGANSDATMSLGTSSARWKDLYLEGGAYIGGTGSANKLGDYETGTWTPNVRDTSGNSMTLNSGNTGVTYTKIGRQVHLQGRIQTTSESAAGGQLIISGLPFTASSGQSGYAANCVGRAGGLNSNAGYNVSLMISQNQTYMEVLRWDEGAGTSDMQISEWSDDGYIMFSLSYTV
jgi:hypothetical protein